MSHQTLARFDTNALTVEAREYPNGLVTVWWSDGPRNGEEPEDDRDEAIDAVEQAAADHAAAYGVTTSVDFPTKA